MRYVLIGLACAILGALSGNWFGEIASRGGQFQYSNSRTFAILEVIMLATPIGLVLGCATVFWTRHRNLHIAAVAVLAALLTLAGVGILAFLSFPSY